jgi:hypothetical protein
VQGFTYILAHVFYEVLRFTIVECLKEWAKTSLATEITEFSEKKTQRSLWALWLSPRNWTLPTIEHQKIMNKFLSKTNRKEEDKKPVIVVSGLPRSGTSMMMKMLAEGGLPIVTDELRRADDDNPNGYFELEVVKQLREGNSTWLREAHGKGVKVISSLLEYLPQEHEYKIIFMERDSKEMLASQKKMLDHRGQTSKLSDEEMEQQFQKHLAVTKPWLIRQPNMDVLYINYNALLSEPALLCEKIVDFLELPLNQIRMLTVPDGSLYRNRNILEK